jgi:hypothetical protein
MPRLAKSNKLDDRDLCAWEAEIGVLPVRAGMLAADSLWIAVACAQR